MQLRLAFNKYLPFIAISAIATACPASDFDRFVRPLVVKRCLKCHGGKEVNGEVDFKKFATAKQLRAKPALIRDIIAAVDANDMPPEGEPALNARVRDKLLGSLKTMLRKATSGQDAKAIPIRRLNRFQYNNTVKDLFQLKRDVFPLPEKLMTRYGGYLQDSAPRMPDRVSVASHSLTPQPGLRGVRSFPKDLRAAHGFDNQANQLTLSPLLLDAFLRLSVSIVESPDFNATNVGIWKEFFLEPPAGSDHAAEIRKRLKSFLPLAFRGPVDQETLDRYATYAVSLTKRGVSFTQSMKKLASAVLSSPIFLYRSGAAAGQAGQFVLASNLSFFLWASGPDRALLEKAKKGQLTDPRQLNKTIDRMLADPKIERFLDTFPSQWMQLENVLAATPDPRKHRLFSLDKNNPAGLQMLLEPLLLFDAVFIENRPIIDLISPDFTYQSELLKAWYTTDLKPPRVDVGKITEENRKNEARRQALQSTIAVTQSRLEALTKPVRARLLAARKKAARAKNGAKKQVDLKPYAAWEFEGNLKDSVQSLDLQAHGKIEFKDGMVVLKRSFLLSKKLPIELRAKTLEVWFKLDNLDQRGGGLMGIQGPGDFFDTIVIGERKPRHWISGSNGFSRTRDFPGSTPENASNKLLQLTMVYQTDGTTTLYRNGKPYGKSYRHQAATFPKNNTSVIFGLRHLPAGGNKWLTVSIDKARLYNRALSAAEVAASSSGASNYISEKELWTALDEKQKKQHESLVKRLGQAAAEKKSIPPNRDPRKVQQEVQRRFDDQIRGKLRSRNFTRVAASDPRYGGVITNAAMLSMTSGPKRTHPIARGAWIIEVIFNDPPPPPPNDVPPLNEEATAKNLTIREKFAQHRENAKCASCHARLDPLGFALENFDITGRWRKQYENGRKVDSSGTLMRKYKFDNVVRFKQSLVKEKRRFAKAFTGHLLRFALSRELSPFDSLSIDAIVDKTAKDEYRLKSIIRQVVLSKSFLPAR